jgi:hypothetical protein
LVNADPDPGFDDKSIVKLNSWKKSYFFRNCNFFIPRPSWKKDVQAPRKAFSPQKENIQYFKTCNSSLFSIFVGNFRPPGSGSSRPKLMRIHADQDPDPQPCEILSSTV